MGNVKGLFVSALDAWVTGAAQLGLELGGEGVAYRGMGGVPGQILQLIRIGDDVVKLLLRTASGDPLKHRRGAIERLQVGEYPAFVSQYSAQMLTGRSGS